MVLEKTLESPLDCKEIQPVSSKGYQSWVFIGRTDAEAETPILWPPDVKNWLIGKDPDAGKDWKWEEKGTTEDEMVGWHHQLDGLESEQALGVGGGQGSLACCSPWGCKESGMTEQLNWGVKEWMGSKRSVCIYKKAAWELLVEKEMFWIMIVSVSIFWLIVLQFHKTYHWGKLGKGYTGLLWVISYKFMWICNDLKIRHLIKGVR